MREAAVSEAIWYPPVISLAELPSEILDLAESIRHNGHRDSDLLTKRVGSLLSTNLWGTHESTALHKAFVALATRYHCNRDGFSFTLKEDSMDALVREMKELLTSTEKVSLSAGGDPEPDLEPGHHRGSKRDSIFDELNTVSDSAKTYRYIRVDSQLSDCADDLQKRLLYTLMHRLDVGIMFYGVSSKDPNDSSNDGGSVKPIRGRRRAVKARSTMCDLYAKSARSVPSAFDAAVDLLSSLDASAQSDVCRLLLDRRLLVPWCTPIVHKAESVSRNIAALDLVNTTINRGNERVIRSSLATDMTHLRVALITERSAEDSEASHWVKGLFNVESLHVMDRKQQAASKATEAAMEIGWGFVKVNEEKSIPVVLLHVIGQYRCFQAFIESYCDGAVAGVGSSGDCALRLSQGWLLKWSHANSSEEEAVAETDEGDKFYVESMKCKFTVSTDWIADFLLEQLERGFEPPPGRLSLTSAATGSTEISVPIFPRVDCGNLLKKIDFSRVRSELNLQLLFAEESKERIVCQRSNDAMRKSSLPQKIKEFEKMRATRAPTVAKHELIGLFLAVLRIESISGRVLAVLDLERWLTEQTAKQDSIGRLSYRAARDVWNAEKNEANRVVLVKSLDDWGMRTVGLEHLWREVSHLFVADPTNRSRLPELAAKHLLDGFSLELMDGDAGMINIKWIRSVLKALREELGSARLLVLSVMGKQSSGKTAMLNYMFGVRLRTSVSRCTRGVTLQVLKCEGRSAYDYIALLDTEGIRAPEFADAEDSIWRDNRMATLAILPADATLVLIQSEDAITIKEILPIVLLAYWDTQIAHENGGQIPSKLLFVFNRIDMSEASKLDSVVDTLMQQLSSSSEKATVIERGDHVKYDEDQSKKSRGSSTAASEATFNLSVDMKERVCILGFIKKALFPPHDTLDPSYGKGLVTLREQAHKAVTQGDGWKGRTVRELDEFIGRVWESLERSNFNLNFKAMYDRINYDILNERMNECAFKLTAAYCEAFETISNNITANFEKEKDKQVSMSEKSSEFCSSLASATLAREQELEMEVKNILSDTRFGNWATDQRSRWNYTKADQKAYWDRLVRDKVDNVFQYNVYVDKYKKKLRSEANDLSRDQNWMDMSDDDKTQKFDEIFNRIVRLAQAEHPPAYHDVCKKVDQVFLRSNLTSSVVTDPPKKKQEPGWWEKWAPPFTRMATPTTSAAVINTVDKSINDALLDVKRYDDETVTKCIKLTNAAFDYSRSGSVSVEFKREVFLHVKKLLQNRLRKIQLDWDKDNSVSSRFEASRTEMKQYFELVGKGFHGAKLLRVTMRNWLQTNLQQAFEEELAMLMFLALKDKNWVSSGEIMQALLDKDLVRLLKQRQVRSAIIKIRRPRQHMDEIISALVQTRVQNVVKVLHLEFLNKIQTCLTTAAENADTAALDRSRRFLESLRDELPTVLKHSAAALLQSKMPDAKAAMFYCDDQPDVFKSNDKDYVCLPMLEVLQGAEQSANIDVSKRVIQLFHKLSYGADKGVRPRCGEPCPHCSCPCTRTRGHSSSADLNDNRHDTHHQPVGLAGGRMINSHELVAQTCCNQDLIFQHNDKWYPYTEFGVVFTDWCQPTETFPLPLREYIFYNFQDELVACTTNTKPCPSIPASFNRPISEIEDSIDQLCERGA
ncbi:hypothetical protein PHYPSEUDO_014546 [Phytophthora pseudosyringae]|uniref:VLIG-type G domain-containing protein n=1 Tax=Phytophthora pseudosyringae TaxID=221518 RepID=A0A8T1W511_9STRA|nr:hypothetical protein PHYPSEUDO_014546 [Phytophthora pseudosyringae]